MNFYKIIILEKDSDQRLDRYLRKLYPHLKQSNIEQAIRKSLVRVNDKKTESKYKILEDDVISIAEFLTQNRYEDSEQEPIKKTKKISLDPKKVKFWHSRILYQDDDIIIINKPINIAVQGGTGITQSLDDILPIFQFDSEERPKLVHRLDKDTSGVMLIARNRKVASELTKMFNNHSIKKTYHAVVVGDVKPLNGVIDMPIFDKESGVNKKAITEYKVIDSLKGYISLLELNPLTGRKHQIRIHCYRALSAPILADFHYGGDSAYLEGFGNKIHLHAKRISFNFKGKEIKVSAPVSDHFLETYRLAGFKDK